MIAKINIAKCIINSAIPAFHMYVLTVPHLQKRVIKDIHMKCCIIKEVIDIDYLLIYHIS